MDCPQNDGNGDNYDGNDHSDDDDEDEDQAKVMDGLPTAGWWILQRLIPSAAFPPTLYSVYTV